MDFGIWSLCALGLLVAAIAAYLVSYKLGRVSVLKEQAQAIVEAKNEEIKATLNRHSKSDLVDVLRKGKF